MHNPCSLNLNPDPQHIIPFVARDSEIIRHDTNSSVSKCWYYGEPGPTIVVMWCMLQERLCFQVSIIIFIDRKKAPLFLLYQKYLFVLFFFFYLLVQSQFYWSYFTMSKFNLVLFQRGERSFICQIKLYCTKNKMKGNITLLYQI